jgi:hypothetical protein
LKGYASLVISIRLTLLVAVAGFSGALLAQSSVAADECARTAGMQVYSSVFMHQETGDLLGYDLAIKRDGDSSVEALLYVYEGGESGDGIPLSGRISNKRLSIQGTWIEHLVEYPSKKKIVEERFVKVVGTVDSAAFRGKLTIESMGGNEQVRLKRVTGIWSCRNLNPSPAN